jgi:phage gp16-like protein
MKTTPRQDLTRREIAKIHMLKNRLGLDDDAYRAMLKCVGGAASSKALTAQGRARVLDHLARLAGKNAHHPDRPRNLDQNARIQKIEAYLAEARRPWSYAHALAKRIAKRDRLEFCTTEDLGEVIAALEYDARRKGRRTA